MSSGSTSVISTVASVLGSLTPTQTLLLGGHLTSSNEAKAMQILAVMQANPMQASAFVGSLSQIPNLPAQVMTLAGEAIASLPNTVQFTSYIVQAETAMQTALASENALQQAFGL